MQKSTRAVQEISDNEYDFENIDLSDLEAESDSECKQKPKASDKAVSNNSKSKYVPTGQKITYSEKIIESKTAYKRFKKITKEKFDGYDFNNPFIEHVIHYKDQPLYVHLFFDIDDINSTDEYDELIEWLDSLKTVFGDYAIGGYCNNEEMAAYGYKLIGTATKYASVHAAFYQTAINADEIYLMCRKSTKGMWSKIDESIYTIQNPANPNDPSKDTQKQTMRFVLSDKVYRPGDPKNAETAGVILDGKLPHMCTYQVWGGERIVSRAEWSKLFTITEDKPPKRNTVKTNVPETTQNTNIAATETSELYASPDFVIHVGEDVVLELLNEFEPTHAQLENIGCLLMHSPFDKETVERLLKQWYFQDGTDHHNKDTIDAYLKYYRREYTNRWLFSIIKKIPDVAHRGKWYNEFNNKGIDPDIKIDLEDDFSLMDIRKNDYTRVGGKGIDAMRFMNDLKRCAILFGTGTVLVAIKCYNSLKEINTIEIITEEKFINTLKGIKIGYYRKNDRLKECNAFMVYDDGKNKNCLLHKGMRFYSTAQDVFSYFQGYDYKELEDYDEDVISVYLNHIRENIANGNEELYNYILNWISYILQNPGGKTETCLVITGEQGTGKNTFTDVICNLMQRYSVRNLTDISHLVGKFNSVIENNKLIVCNELSSADSNLRMNADSLKSIITEKVSAVESKYMEPRMVENVVNLIILSNHFDPVKVENGDRRYVVCNTNEIHKNDQDYFGALINTFTEEFYQNLFTYFMKRNLDGVNLRILPKTEAKDELIEANKSRCELFIQDFINDFKVGFQTDKAYTYFNKWAFNNGFITKDKKVQSNVFGKELKPYVDNQQKRIEEEDGSVSRKRVYILKDSKKGYFDLNKYENEDDYKEFKKDVRRKCQYFN